MDIYLMPTSTSNGDLISHKVGNFMVTCFYEFRGLACGLDQGRKRNVTLQQIKKNSMYA